MNNNISKHCKRNTPIGENTCQWLQYSWRKDSRYKSSHLTQKLSSLQWADNVFTMHSGQTHFELFQIDEHDKHDHSALGSFRNPECVKLQISQIQAFVWIDARHSDFSLTRFDKNILSVSDMGQWATTTLKTSCHSDNAVATMPPGSRILKSLSDLV